LINKRAQTLKDSPAASKNNKNPATGKRAI